MADPNRVADLAHDIAKRLISLDPVEHESVINQYFESNVTLKSNAIALHGVSRVKKLTSLQADLAFESHLVGHPSYNSEEQAIYFAFERTYYPPSVPAYLPFSDSINRILHKGHFRGTWDTKLHLNSVEEDDGQTKLFVTKVGPTNRRDTTYLENHVPWNFIRPILSLLTIIIADLLGFFRRHPFPDEGPITIILAAIAESWAWLTGTPIDRQNYPWPIKRAQGLGQSGDKVLFDAYGSVQGHARRVSESGTVHQGQSLINSAIDLANSTVHSAVGLAGASVDSAKSLIGKAIDTAGAIEHQGVQAVGTIAGSVYNLAQSSERRFEQEAKKRGIPVDEYKELAEKNVSDVASWFGLVKQQAKEQSQNAKNKAKQAKNDAKDAGKKYGFDANDYHHHNQVTTDTGPHSDSSNGARTPHGGHDPHHPNAPSYAQVAHSDHHLAAYGQTPLGPAVTTTTTEEVDVHY